MKIFLADDSALIREGLGGILERTGHEIIGHAQDAGQLRSRVSALLNAGEIIDVLITDVRMPPGMNDDGLRTTIDLRREFPQLNVMVLSQYIAPTYTRVLFSDGKSAEKNHQNFSPFSCAYSHSSQGGLGYLLKDRVARAADFVRSLGIVAAGGVVVDPEVAAGLVQGKSSALENLSPRELEVLELMAQGLSNSDIAAQLYLSGAAVSKHVANVFRKLGLASGEENRRVRAVLTYLTEQGIM